MAQPNFRLANDMSKMLVGRVRTVLADAIDTMERGGMSSKEIAAVLLSVLLGEAINGFAISGMSEDDLVDCVRLSLRTHPKVKRKSN